MKEFKKSIFGYVDCIQLYIPDIEKGIAYYCDGLGLKLND
ncbi:VOC family protein [Fusibacter sp. 3D3]|nr:VOC family protein [Fusibacter sp. 3D3]GAU80021.1 hypothetical protein F3D3_4687 [Fusibacter sp. 3D3]